jgi:hypothetical protein
MTKLPCTRTICFEHGLSARAVEVALDSDPIVILDQLALDPFPYGAMLISGGADDYPPCIVAQTRRAIESVIRFAFDRHILLVDGGTNTGVMGIIGEIFAQVKRTSQTKRPPPLIGFVPKFMVTYAGAPCEPRCSKPAQLDPNHPYFVLVHGTKEWGGEIDCLFNLVGLISKRIPSIGIIANGGLTTLREAVYSVRQGKELIVFEGSKRAAEVIVAAIDGEPESELTRILREEPEVISPGDSRYEAKLEQALSQLREIAQYSKITRFSLHESPAKLTTLLSSKLELHLNQLPEQSVASSC